MADKKLCLTLTGGGTMCVPTLMAKCGASKLIESINIPYGTGSFQKILQNRNITEPKSYFSEDAVIKLLIAQIDWSNKDLFHVAVSCSLNNKDSSGEQRDGRVNGAHMVGISTDGVWYRYAGIDSATSRNEQEVYVAHFIKEFVEFVESNSPEFRVIGSLRGDMYDIISAMNDHNTFSLFAGSFNPWHDGHEYIYSGSFYSTPQIVEITSTAIGKDMCQNLHDRVAKIPNKIQYIIESKLSRYVDKNKFLKHFMYGPSAKYFYKMGLDTYLRIPVEEKIELFSDERVKCYVINRGMTVTEDEFISNKRVIIVENTQYAHISSTKIRGEKQ